MSSNLKYFEIPFDNVPEQPTYTVWFATWSRERPLLEPGMNPPMVVGITAEDEIPAGAALIGISSKDPPPPPPPPPPSGFGASEYQAAVRDWLAIDRSEDE